MDFSGVSRIDEDGTLFVDVVSNEFCIDVSQVDKITLVGFEAVKAERDRYKKALEEIVKQLIYDDEEELKEWFADIPDDMRNDYRVAFELAKHALEGDEE